MTQETSLKKVKSKQLLNLFFFAFIVLIGLFAILALFSNHVKKATSTDKIEFASALPSGNAESFVLEKTQKQLREYEKKTAALQRQMTEIHQMQEGQEKQEREEGSSFADKSYKLTEKLESRVDELEKKLAEKERAVNEFSQRMNTASYMHSSSIREDHLQLTETEESIVQKRPIKNPDTYVPAGTFVQAVMLGGADASTAVNAKFDPVPMLFRLIADGTLPNHQKSHLKGCFALASVIGDISSERGLIRVKKLSCTFPDSTIVDQKIKATIFGIEGKNGVRGIPLWREDALLQRAFVAGTLSGISNGVSQSYTTNSISADGAVQTVNPSRIFQYGAANGVGKAMDKLADYNIKRAEQYHPVIQLSAGTIVDIVIQRGFYLDGREHPQEQTGKGEKAKKNKFNRYSEFNRDNANQYGQLSGVNASSYLRQLPKVPDTNSPSSFPGVNTAQFPPLSMDEVKRIEAQSKALGLDVTPIPTQG